MDTKRGEIQSLQRQVRRALAERRAAVRPLSGLPPLQRPAERKARVA